MTQHVCQRCGHEEPCSYGSWPDRHPVVATVGGLFALVFMGMMLSVHPVSSAVMIALALSWAGVRAIAREWRRRNALVARADYEHAQIQLRSTIPPLPTMPYPRRPSDRFSIACPPARTRPLPQRR
ncbi:hypothetical protein EV580_1286 [Mycobacterium sp. BK086]|uniref:hypothetical protein n=1 Tax=Mycobacterium sp. BK086 TaxID=2512165 RepID=UPI00105FF4DE|nr:hypothetical protein [Mycobacterium sp. BK086]TDO18105.1 hypothetical protein EV580_1286 [Mycobacterium sp. BK086]